MKSFFRIINNICNEYKKVAMFVDMDGTINEYTIYVDDKILTQMGENYNKAKPIEEIINTLEKISKINNIDIYILSLSKNQKITEEKKIWLKKYTEFIPEKNWIILTKENGDYDHNNRNQIKSLKMKEKLNQYDHVIFLDDDHIILKETNRMLKEKVSSFHVTSALV